MSAGTRWDQLQTAERLGSGPKGQSVNQSLTATTLAGYAVDGVTLTATAITVASVVTTASTRQAFFSYFLSGKPDASATAYLPIPGNMASVEIPANFTGAKGGCTNPTVTAVYTFYKNGSSFGTASISTGGVFTWATSGGVHVTFAPGTDEISWTAPGSQDATLSNVRFAVPLIVS